VSASTIWRQLGMAMCLLLTAGCFHVTATEDSLQRLHVGMTKQDVTAVMGNPSTVRGTIVNKYDQQIEVWEYVLYPAPHPAYYTSKPPTKYWVHFCNGKVAQWGEAGDWFRESDRVREVKFE